MQPIITYTLNQRTGELKHGDEVIPVDDREQAYLTYVTWLQQGNGPTMVEDDPRIAIVEQMRQQITAERDRRKFNGVLVSGKWIHTDTYSRTQWIGMTMLGQNLPVIPWTSMDGTTINTTPALAQAVFQAVLTLDATTFAVAKAHKTAMEASDEPGAYNFSSGWMPTFEG